MSEGGGGFPTPTAGTIEAIDELFGGSGEIFGVLGPASGQNPANFPVFNEAGDVIGLTNPLTGDIIPVSQPLTPEQQAAFLAGNLGGPLGGNIVGSFTDIVNPPIAITQFPVDPPIAITQFPSEIQTFPATTAPTSVFDVFRGVFEGISNQASNLLSLGLQFFGPSPQPAAVGTGTVGQPLGGAPVPIHAAIGQFLKDTATVTLEGLVAQAPQIISAVLGPAQPIATTQPVGPIGLPPLTSGGFAPVSAPIALPGGARTAGFDIPGIDIVPQGAVCISPRPTGSFRLPSRVDVPVPQRDGTMRFTTFKNMGRPILWSGDLAAVKRVRRVASKAKRRVGGR